MRKKTLMLVAAAFLLTTTAGAGPQQPTPHPQGTTPAQERAPQPRPPEPPGQPVNVKVELVITDQAGPGEPAKKTVSMILADRHPGSIRTQGNMRVGVDRFPVELNVDAQATILKDDQMRLLVGLQYQPRPDAESNTETNRLQQLNQRQTLIVTSGKPIVISQAADPASDRKIIAELTATILK